MILMACCLATTACDDVQQRAAIAARDAELALQAGDLDAAEARAAEASQLRDSEAAYWELLGRVQLQRNKLAEAFSSFQRVVELDPGNLNAVQIVSELAFQGNQQKLADEMADRALVLAPSSTRALLVKGLIALDKGKPDIAKELAAKILVIDPKDEFGIVLNARAMAAQGQIGEAALTLARDIEVNNRSEASLVTLVELHRRTGNYAELKSAIETLLAKQGNSIQLSLDYANILYRGGATDKARRVISKVISDKSISYDDILSIRQLWAEFDPNPLSRPDLNGLINTSSFSTRLEVAKHYIDRNDPITANALLPKNLEGEEKAIRLQGNGLKSRILYLQNRRDEALRLADSIIKDDTSNIDARLVRSKLRQSAGNLTGALEDAQVAAEGSRESELARSNLTQVLMKRDGTLRAVQSIAAGLEAMPQSTQMLDFAVRFLIEQKLNDHAIGVAKQFTSDNPSSVKGWKIYMFACEAARSSTCASTAAAGSSYAKSVFVVDQLPGSRKKKGLFGDLKIDCTSDQRICT